MILEKLLANKTVLPPLSNGKPCLIDNTSYLGLLQLPLIARLQGCSRLLVDVTRRLRLVGVDGTCIDLDPLTSGDDGRLRAYTPLNEPATTVDWVIPVISSNVIRGLVGFLGLLDAGVSSLANPLPYEIVVEDLEGVVHGFEGGRIEVLHPVKRVVESKIDTVRVDGGLRADGDSVLVELANTTIVLSPFKLDRVVRELYPNNRVRLVAYSTSNDVLVLGKDEVVVKPSSRITLRVEYDLYNPLIKVLQPLAFAETRKHTSIAKSKIMCIVDDTREICVYSTSTLKATIAPGILVLGEVNSTIRISYGRSGYTATNSLRRLLFQLNGQVRVNGRLRYGYLRITPYTALLLGASFSVREDLGMLSLYLLNITSKVTQVEVTLPARIVKANVAKLGENAVDEVEADYNSLVLHMDKYSLYKVDLSLKKFPPLFLKELSKRPSISTYTAP